MNKFVESLKRLYKEQQITYAHVLSFYEKGKISKEVAEYILNAPISKERLQKGRNITS